MTVDRTEVINTRGCKDVMYSWYRSGFVENIVMAIIGLAIGAYEFYLYSLNRREYFNLLDEYDDMRKPMMNATMSMSTINSKGSGNQQHHQQHQPGQMINFGQHPVKMPLRAMNPQQTPSIGGGSTNNLIPQVPQTSNNQSFINPLQIIQNNSGKFGFNRPTRGFNQQNNPPSDRVLIDESDISQS